MVDVIDDEESTMRGEGWKKAITLKWITIKEDGTVLCQEYDYFSDRMPCRTRELGTGGPMCGFDHTWVRILKGKVFWACHLHQHVNGPLAHSLGTLAQSYIVPPTKALEICRETGQTPPPTLISLIKAAVVKKGRRRRPSDVK